MRHVSGMQTLTVGIELQAQENTWLYMKPVKPRQDRTY